MARNRTRKVSPISAISPKRPSTMSSAWDSRDFRASLLSLTLSRYFSANSLMSISIVLSVILPVCRARFSLRADLHFPCGQSPLRGFVVDVLGLNDSKNLGLFLLQSEFQLRRHGFSIHFPNERRHRTRKFVCLSGDCLRKKRQTDKQMPHWNVCLSASPF